MASMGLFVSNGDAAMDEGCSADEADSGVVANSSEVRFRGANKREMIEIVIISVTSARKTTLTPVRDTAAALLVEGSTRSRPVWCSGSGSWQLRASPFAPRARTLARFLPPASRA